MRQFSIVLSLIVALATAAFAAEAPGHLDAFRIATDARRSELGDPADAATRKVATALDKALRAVAADKAGRSRKHEILAGAKAAALLESKAPDETALLAALDAARDSYETLLGSDRTMLRAIADTGALSKGAQRKAEAALKRGDKQIAKLAAATSRKKSFAAIRKADAALSYIEKLAGTGGDHLEQAWIIASLTLADGEGFDFNGDKKIDNAFGSLLASISAFVDLDLDGALAAGIEDGSLLLALQMWDLDSFDKDPLAWASVLPVEDGDDDTSDNFSGTEPFVPELGDLDADGHAVTRAPVALTGGGAYDVVLSGGIPIPFADQVLTFGESVRVSAVASSTTNDGVIGVLLSREAVTQLARTLAGDNTTFLALIGPILDGALDVDVDGDRTNDHMSAAFTFTSVPCTLIER